MTGYRLNNKEMYKLLNREDKIPISCANTEKVYHVDGFFEHSFSPDRNIMIIKMKDGEVLVTSSKMFIRTFKEIFELFCDAENPTFKFRIVKVDVQKDGRPLKAFKAVYEE